MNPPLKSQPALDVQTLQAHVGEFAAVASPLVDYEIGMSIPEPGEEERVRRLGSSLDVDQVPLAHAHALGAGFEMNGKRRRDDDLETGHRKHDRFVRMAGPAEQALHRRHVAVEIRDLEEGLDVEPAIGQHTVTIVPRTSSTE